MTKRIKKKCSTSKTFFDYTCPNLATKRSKQPNSTKTKFGLKRQSSLIYAENFKKTFFVTIRAKEVIEETFHEKHLFEQKVLNGFSVLLQFLTFSTDFQFLRCFTVFVVFKQTIQAIEAFEKIWSKKLVFCQKDVFLIFRNKIIPKQFLVFFSFFDVFDRISVFLCFLAVLVVS